MGRTTACILFVCIFFAVYELQLFNWQIINGETFEQEAMSNRIDAVEVSAARGEILDKDGEVLAGNHIVYEVIYNALYMDDSRRNATILEVVDLLKERGEPWRDILPIELDEQGNYRFIEGQEDEIETLKSRDFLNLADYATADDCMAELARKYRYEGHSKEDTRTVASVRYNMTKEAFSIYDPYVIATGVSADTVGVFGEYANTWKGIETRVNVERYYPDGTLAPHLIGFTGKVEKEDLDRAKEEGTLYDSETNITGYKDNEVIGKLGAEAAFESDLRGKRGLRAVFTDENGDVTTTAVKEQPEQGHTVTLTLDSQMQRIANRSLEKNIKANKNSGLKDDKRAHDCRAGAAVAIDLTDFGVLACASYPSYDLNQYLTDMDWRLSALEDEENRPLFCRALDGAYTPGSVFKPMVAIAGLQEGEVSSGQSLYNCDGPGYTGVFVFHDLELACTSKHFNANVFEAISGSCNCYFAQLGLELGIRRLDAYAEYFGLGSSTGIEISESTGNMSNPQSYQRLHSDLGEEWTDGVTAQAAIGQADDMFTTMQLATYAATLANGGQRLRTHFLKEVTDYSRQELVRRYEPEVLYDAEISGDVNGVVRQAMCLTATEGTARGVFANYPVQIACKTGTAETSAALWEDGGTEENISFIGYAPANDPKIAVAVVLEHGRSGAYAMNVAKDIFDYYFGFYTWDEEGNRYDQDGNLVDDDGNVVKTKEELDEEKAAKNPSPSPSPSGEPGGEDPESGESSSEPEPTATPVPDRGSDIPDAIYTAAASVDPPGETEPQGEPTPEPERRQLDTPYYSGRGSAAASPPPEGAEPEEGESG